MEQSTLGPLRDFLCDIYAATSLGPLLPSRCQIDSLFDFLDSPTNKTSRVAQAIASIQQLIFALRTGELFRYRTSATSALYPTLTLEAEHIETEWQWMGSYGSWRSALFIFMYPENLLYPTLRSANEQSEFFKGIVSQVQSNGTIALETTCALAEQYQFYYSDVSSLYVARAALRAQLLVEWTVVLLSMLHRIRKNCA